MQVLNVVFYDLPIEDLQTFRDRVNAVTTADIERVAKAYLKPDRLSVVLVGNLSAFGSDLRGVGFNTFETVELGNLDLTRADFKRATPKSARAGLPPKSRALAYQPTVGAGAQAGATSVSEDRGARGLLASVITAKGGRDALQALRNITVTTKTTIGSPEGQVEAEATTYLEYPNRVRVETTLQKVASVQIFDGEHAWVRDPAGVHDVPERFTRDLQASLRRDTIALLLAADRGAARVRQLPDVTADGRLVPPVGDVCSGCGSHRAVRRSRHVSDYQTNLRGTRTRSAPGGRKLQRLSSRRRYPVCLPGHGSPRQPDASGAPLERDQGQHATRPCAVPTSGSLSARLMLSCGEASGDLYAGALLRELRALEPGIEVRGFGGAQFADAGGQLIADYRGLAVAGLAEVVGKLPAFFATIRRLVASARRSRPDALVAIDSPDFNFPLARRLKRLNIPVVYYISPQFWAWRPGRLKSIRDIADLVLVIFPFEETLYQQAGVPVRFVGHPLIDLVKVGDRTACRQRFGLPDSSPVIALLPAVAPARCRASCLCSSRPQPASDFSYPTRGLSSPGRRASRTIFSRRRTITWWLKAKPIWFCLLRTWHSPRRGRQPSRPRFTTHQWSSSTRCRR